MAQCKAEFNTNQVGGGVILFCVQDIEDHDPNMHWDDTRRIRWPVASPKDPQ